MIAPSEPKTVMLSFKTRTVSRYVPGETSMTSPGIALFTAACKVVETTTTAASAEAISTAAHAASAAAKVSLPMDYPPHLESNALFDYLQNRRFFVALE